MTSNAPSADLTVLAGRGSASSAAAAIPPPRTRWASRVLLPAVLLIGVGGLLAASGWDGLMPAHRVRVIPAVAKVTNVSAGECIVQAPGWVEPDPYPQSVTALADGVVREVLVLEGQTVTAGQVVARLIDDDARLTLGHAESQMAEANAAVASAEAALEAAQQTWDNPVERVRARDQTEAMLAEARAELARLPAEIEVEKARLKEATEKLNRVKRLYEGQTLQGMELIRAQAGYDAQEALVKSTEARRPVLEAKVAQREAEAVAARENARLRIEETRALADAKAALEKAKADAMHSMVTRDEAALRLSRMEIKAASDGIVINRLIGPGSKLLVNMNDPASAVAMRTYDPAHLQVRVDVPLADAATVSVGQEARIVVDVLPDRTFKGRVTRVVNEADIQKNTLQFKVAITDPEPRLRPEMLARVKILIPAQTTGDAEARQGLFVPADLVQKGDKGPFVMLADRNRGRAIRRAVTVGATVDGWVEVQSGLNVGDQLLAGEATRLDDGTRVEVIGESNAPIGPKKEESGHGHD